MTAPALLVRSYRRADRQAVRDLCAHNCWMGEYRPECIPDDWTWAEFWTRYFTDRESRHCWVVERSADGAVLGYLTGTSDARMADAYAKWIMPGIVWHVIRHRLIRERDSRRAIWAMVRSMFRGEMGLPHGLAREYPATMHINLLAEARGRGLARQMVDLFLDAMRAAGVPGVHGQILSLNARTARFNEKLGMRLADRRPITAFRHVESQPIEQLTYVMKL